MARYKAEIRDLRPFCPGLDNLYIPDLAYGLAGPAPAPGPPATPVPEPTILILLGCGLAGFASIFRRRELN